MATILVVEDNEMLQVMVARWLKRRGHQVCVAGDGAQGLALAHSEQPDVILMDMNIPLLDGWTLTRTLKATTATQHIPIIGLSADARADDRARGLAAGCVAYYTKPLDFPPLLDYIDRLVNQPAPDNAGHRPVR
ncbi:MAG: response regulator [Chloroflexota bacterium]|nr:response regulator [Chloroflexota bacterium]